jgi:PAS domain S-box-containing protein
MRSPRSGRNATRPVRSGNNLSDESKQANGERTEEHYLRLVENFPEAIAILDEERVLFINAVGARLVGAEDAEALIGKPYLDFVHPDFQEMVKSRVLRVQRDGVTAELLELRLLRLDGTSVDVEAMVMPVIYESKAATLSVIRDITGRKRAEEALKESEERYRAVMEQSVEPISLYDARSKRVLE